MSEIKWALNIQVVEGPKIAVTDSIDVEVYDKFDVLVGAGATQAFEIGAGEVQFLLVKAEPADSRISYTVNADNKAFGLDRAQVLVGGAVKMLGNSLNKLTFTNKTAKEAQVYVLVGREAATPAPPPAPVGGGNGGAGGNNAGAGGAGGNNAGAGGARGAGGVAPAAPAPPAPGGAAPAPGGAAPAGGW